MAGDDEIDPIKVRTGLFALITARLEDAHETAVKGQSRKASADDLEGYNAELGSIIDEIAIHIDTVSLLNSDSHRRCRT